MIDSESLFKAKSNLNKFLEEHPHLKEEQQKIETLLQKCGSNSQNRLALLQTLIRENLEKLSTACKELMQEVTQAEKDK